MVVQRLPSLSRFLLAVLLAWTISLPSTHRMRFADAQDATATSAPVATTTATPVTSDGASSAPAPSPSSSSSEANDDGGWGGCVNLRDNSTSLKIGERTIVCLQIGNSVNWARGLSYIRLSFTPETDQYSRFYVPKSYANLVANNTGTIWQNKNITLGAASHQSLSFLRMYYNVQAKKIYPFLTAIVNVDKGNITSITWDDACVFCSPNECEEITYDFNGNLQSTQSSGQPTSGCFIPQSGCQSTNQEEEGGSSSNNPGANVCDLVLYVVWSGTDAGNRAFQSSNSRFSVFPPQNIQDRIKQLVPEIPMLDRRERELQEQPFQDGEAVVEVVPGVLLH